MTELDRLRDELRQAYEALVWCDGGLGLASQLHAALKELIPSPGSLSPEKHALWHQVVNVIYESAEHSDGLKPEVGEAVKRAHEDVLKNRSRT